MIGTQVEREGIIRHGAKMISAVSEATVPKISVIVRKAYGAGLYAMAGPAFDPDCCLALPTASIAVMGPQAAINAVYYNQLQAIEDDGRARGADRGAARRVRAGHRHPAPRLRARGRRGHPARGSARGADPPLRARGRQAPRVAGQAQPGHAGLTCCGVAVWRWAVGGVAVWRCGDVAPGAGGVSLRGGAAPGERRAGRAWRFGARGWVHNLANRRGVRGRSPGRADGPSPRACPRPGAAHAECAAGGGQRRTHVGGRGRCCGLRKAEVSRTSPGARGPGRCCGLRATAVPGSTPANPHALRDDNTGHCWPRSHADGHAAPARAQTALTPAAGRQRAGGMRAQSRLQRPATQSRRRRTRRVQLLR